jgi:UDP-glucose 4-epimerase
MTGETILVVGGAGYIGSHMVKDLVRADKNVVVLDNLARGHRDLVPGGVFVEGDLGDSALLDRVFSEYKIDAVMHFAAYSLVGESVEKPLAYYRNNISRTIELLEAMIRHAVRRFIFSSTAAVYGEPENVPITEEHPCRPTNPYGESKLAVEQLLADCARAGDLQYVSLRYFNAAGADVSGDLGERHGPETHLIPLVLQAALGEREGIQIFGTDYPTSDGTCLRDYVHVSDLTRAHLLALQRLTSGGNNAIYNLGNSKGYSVREVIETARRVTGHSIPTVASGRRAGDPAVLVADSGKIRGELGWKPRYEDLQTIIETAWVWHQREAQRKKNHRSETAVGLQAPAKD